MLKLLIADDNDFERSSLANYINWEILGIKLVDTAFNGQDAVEKAKLHHPDIIISDIKMPVMDGIEMAKVLKTIYPEIKFIFSSGYDDVALLKEALEIRAFNYILKPVNPDELINTVKKVVSIITDEKLLTLENNSIIKQYRDNLTFLQSKFLESLLLKERSPEEISEVVDQTINLKLRIIGDYRLVLVDLDFESEDIFDVSSRINAILGELRNYLSGENVIFLEVEHNKIAAIMYYQDEKHSKAEITICSINNRLKELASCYNYRFIIGVSSVTSKLTELYMLYRQSSIAVSKKIELGYEHVIYFEKLEKRDQNSASVDKGCIKELIAKTVETVAEGHEFSEEIERVMEAIASMTGSKLENTKSVFISLFNSLSRYMENNGESLEKVTGDDIDVYSYIIGARIIPDILKYVNDTMEKIRCYYVKSQTGKDDYIVEEIRNILDNEYGNPITLTYLSDRVFLSPNYLRILFKNKMNISIQDYLTDVRINKAKEMLKQNCYKIHEVGQMVGYPNSTYFNLVFKGYVNNTPGEYRSKYMSSEVRKSRQSNIEETFKARSQPLDSSNKLFGG